MVRKTCLLPDEDGDDDDDGGGDDDDNLLDGGTTGAGSFSRLVAPGRKIDQRGWPHVIWSRYAIAYSVSPKLRHRGHSHADVCVCVCVFFSNGIPKNFQRKINVLSITLVNAITSVYTV